ncbi:hypothetical protein [Devosia sp.]|uniref:hypothetical protein n=1 Tax=Devosia sp. TaxID=1871048 RepID=UPI00326670CA
MGVKLVSTLDRTSEFSAFVMKLQSPAMCLLTATGDSRRVPIALFSDIGSLLE